MHPAVGLLLTATFAFIGQLRSEEQSYPKPELLAEPSSIAKAEVAKSDYGKSFVVLDARERAKYDQGHVPNARWVDHAAWAKAFGDGQDAEGWSKRIGELGIAADAHVIVYDDNNAKDAARIWWILRYWGLEDARLLNGGWQGWESGALPADKTEPPPAKTNFSAKAQSNRLATKGELLKSLEGSKIQIVDARSEKEFCGDEKLTNKRAGAIPGAKQLEWSDLIDKASHRFKPSGELRKLFEDAGITLDKPTATHCQSGGRASVMAFGLELMGAKDVRNYYASWAEWSSADDTPVAPGKAKEKK
jgi:thiosulfate/3-mercaptopyruvate sulfurtransferase